MAEKFPDTAERYLRFIMETQGIDILFECFVGLLVHSGQADADHFQVIPRENNRRNYKNDIVSSPREHVRFDPERYLTEDGRGGYFIYTSRSSILDYLPEDLYIEPDNTQELSNAQGRPRSPSEREAYRAQRREQLESASRFFKPLEVACNRVRIERELSELSGLEDHDPSLQAFWSYYPAEQPRWKRFIRTLHLCPYFIGDLDKTRAMIRYVLDKEVSLEFSTEASCSMSPAQREELYGRDTVLGYNVMVGSDVYDYLEICTLTIEGVTRSEFYQFIDEESDSRRLLEEIIKHYFPLHVDVRLDYALSKASSTEEGEENSMVLGYSSVLEA